MGWRVAKALDELLGEINAEAPRRNKSADGGIGDAEHASRASDHNPWAPLGRGGVVTARDFTHDPKGGLDCHNLAEHLRHRGIDGDRRIKYIIWNRHISSTKSDWQWRAYSGSNAHTHHLHLSVSPIQTLFDNTAPWRWHDTKPEAVTHQITREKIGKWSPWYTGKVGARTISRWDSGTDVKLLQAFIGHPTTDGYFGSNTEVEVKDYQKMRGLVVDGVVGPKTWAPILKSLGV